MKMEGKKPWYIFIQANIFIHTNSKAIWLRKVYLYIFHKNYWLDLLYFNTDKWDCQELSNALEFEYILNNWIVSIGFFCFTCVSESIMSKKKSP